MPKATTPSPGYRERIEAMPQGLYVKSGVPKRHTRLIDNFSSPKEWVATRERLYDRIGSGFLVALVGKRGPGKTQIAQQVILAANATHRTALYTRAMSIFLDVRATYADDDLAELDVIKKYRAPQMLVIDEMQERGETPWEDRILNHLIDLRYGDMTDTLLIANLTPKAFQASVGESIADRLRETGGIVECTWESMRKRGLNPVAMLRRKEYEDYLWTDRWAELRGLALSAADGKCAGCGTDASVVHHLRYPKKLGTETPDMLEALCAACHGARHTAYGEMEKA